MFRRPKKCVAVEESDSNKWEYYLMKGNEYYFRSQYEGAAYCYSVSVEYLEVVVGRACLSCSDDRCFQHYLIACQNASHSFAMAGDLTKAEQYLSRAHYKFLSLVTESLKKTDTWQESVQRVCERSLDVLVQFLERHNRTGAAESVRFESQRLLG